MIRTRSILVILMIAAQALCLAIGLNIYHARMTDSLIVSICEDTLKENRLLAKELIHLVDPLQLQLLEYGSRNWNRLQDTIESLHLPNDGFACVLDGQGRVLCHPDLRSDPAMRSMQLGAKRIRERAGDDGWPIMAHFDASTTNQHSFAGLVNMPDGTHLIGGVNLPEHNAQFLVHQRKAALVAKVGRMMTPLWRVGAISGLILCLIGGVVTYFSVAHYESSLAGINSNLEGLVQRRTDALVQTRDAVIFGLAKLADSRDPETGQHLERLSIYTTLLAQELSTHPGFADQINRDFVRRIGLSSALHDIGKVGIYDDILLKPGPLTKVERHEMQKHAAIGGNCLLAIEQRLGKSNFLSMATDIAFAHHERWDGAGYPNGLQGEEIPLSARIVALADVYDALTSRRVYKEAMAHKTAIAIIKEGMATQFDPDVVHVFLTIENQFEQVRAGHNHSEETAAKPLEATHLTPKRGRVNTLVPQPV
jgi:HD-GYP domain-containing protein (c-di-GMP phosphodiesterase class II)